MGWNCRVSKLSWMKWRSYLRDERTFSICNADMKWPVSVLGMMFQIAKKTGSWRHTINWRMRYLFLALCVVVNDAGSRLWRGRRSNRGRRRSYPRGRGFADENWVGSRILTYLFMLWFPVCDLAFPWTVFSAVASSAFHCRPVLASNRSALTVTIGEAGEIETFCEWREDEARIPTHGIWWNGRR